MWPVTTLVQIFTGSIVLLKKYSLSRSPAAVAARVGDVVLPSLSPTSPTPLPSCSPAPRLTLDTLAAPTSVTMS